MSTPSYSFDPLPEILPALLNSADIQAYQEACNIIRGEPLEVDRLKAASYRINCHGTIYWADGTGRREHEIKPGSPFTLQPNSIAFISPRVEFNLPDFLAARFNLSISLVHKGLLLGTGPLIDPGFRGQLLIPLHNLTTSPVQLNAEDGIISVEFTKLSPLTVRTYKDRKFDFIHSFPKGPMTGPVVRYFDKTQGIPVQSTLNDNAKIWNEEVVKVRTLQAMATRQEKSLKRWTIVGATAGAVGLVALIVSVYQSYQSSVQVAQNAQNVADAARQSLGDAEKSLAAAKAAIGELSARIARLEKDRGALPPPRAASGATKTQR
ncbi:MAG: hypothetical protein HY855_00060 [Burkholderiales bacterium]|nr:hypothetical protein [Burkholderiales bacterium]